MVSKDIRMLATDEQSFKVYVITKLDGMEQRLDILEAGQKNLRAEVKILADNQGVLSSQITRLDSRVDMGLWVMGIGFSLMTAFIGFVGVAMPLFLSRKKEETPKPESPSVLTYRDVQDMIDRSLRLKGD